MTVTIIKYQLMDRFYRIFGPVILSKTKALSGPLQTSEMESFEK